MASGESCFEKEPGKLRHLCCGVQDLKDDLDPRTEPITEHLLGKPKGHSSKETRGILSTHLNKVCLI